MARQIREFIRKLAGDTDEHRLETELDTGGTLTIIYEPPDVPVPNAVEPPVTYHADESAN